MEFYRPTVPLQLLCVQYMRADANMFVEFSDDLMVEIGSEFWIRFASLKVSLKGDSL